MPPQIKVLVVDDHAIVREGLKSLIELDEGITVVGEASSGIACLDQMKTLNPDVVFMDLKMPGIGGIEAARIIKEQNPRIKVILLTNYDDQEYVVEAIKTGVDAYVLKDVKKGDLIRIIRIVLKGQAYIDPMVAPKVFEQINPQASAVHEPSVRKSLSKRELQILECVVSGKSNREIADQIHLSLDTVKTHIKKIYRKLRVHSRSQAVKKAIQEEIVNLS
ncbi:response regulator [Thermodesulfobacteriota bacterium]